MKAQNIIRHTIILLVFVSVSNIINAQDNYLTLKGIVKNNLNKKQLVVFANVAIEGTNISTVTNIEGEFSIKVQKSLDAKNLVITHVGYDSKVVEISDLNKRKNYIYLKPSDVSVKEVNVRPEDARMMVESALKKVKLNYSNRALNAEGFYRETIKKRRDYLAISEAIIDIYKSSYKSFETDRVKIYKGRKSSNIKKADTIAVKMQGGPKISLMFDIVKHPDVLINLNTINDYNFKLEKIMTIDKRLVYEISFSPGVEKSDYTMRIGRYYIDVESLAIVSADFSFDLSDPDKATKMLVKKKPAGLKITPTKTSYIAHYKKIDGIYFLDYTRSEIRFKCNWKKKLFNSNYVAMSELAITDWSNETAQKIKYKDSFKNNDVFEDKISAFTDDDFWGEHNTIEPDQSIESAIKKYKRRKGRR